MILFVELFPDEVSEQGPLSVGSSCWSGDCVKCRMWVAASLASSLHDMQSWLGVRMFVCHTLRDRLGGMQRSAPIIHWKARPR